jgi:PPK2 family polyphosphate:nucleotide phosphotransferase
MTLADRYLVPAAQPVDVSAWKTDDATIDRPAAEARLANNIDALQKLQHRLYAEKKQSLLVVLQAMDTAGKDSTIRYVLGQMNPQGVQVQSYGRPTERELAQDFLWRIHQHTPRRGHIQVFNRSHYEDVLVVRVENLVPQPVWSERYQIINEFERSLHQAGTQIIKIYLHLSKDRQKEKLAERLHHEHKLWKFEMGDFDTRAKWDDYMKAYQDAITRCNTPHAPWYIVPTDRKWYRLLVVSEILRATLERMNPQFPPAKVDRAEALRRLEEIGEAPKR